MALSGAGDVMMVALATLHVVAIATAFSDTVTQVIHISSSSCIDSAVFVQHLPAQLLALNCSHTTFESFSCATEDLIP